MTPHSKKRIKKIRDRHTGQVKYIAESKIEIRRGKLWIKIDPRLLRRANLYRGSPIAIFAKSGVRTVVVKRLMRAKGDCWTTGIC